MKVLVTGGAGFIGTNLIKRLLNEGHEVVSLDDYETGTKDNHVEGAKYIDGDIETIEYIQGDYDLCFHLAALSRIQPSFENPTETFRVNVRGTEAVCEWAKHNNVKVVYAGSSSKHHDPSQSPYAAYKYLGEEVCKLYKKTYDLNVEICRFYNVYGPDEVIEGDWAAVIGIWRRQVRDGEKITIVGDGEQRRDFTHVKDVVNANILAANLENKKVVGELFNIGTGKNHSILEIKDLISGDFVYIPERKGEARLTLANNKKAKTLLVWTPTVELEDWIETNK